VKFQEFFRGVARVNKAFAIEIGPLRARGAPAILIAVTGIVLASGVAAALVRSVPQLPETLREANGLAKTMRGEPARLNA
jgi:hypothetical protein